jgi:hypothetical protein
VCGFAVACLAGRARGGAVEAADLRPFAKRTLAAPVTLRELAAAEPAAGYPDQPPSGGNREREHDHG